ncbi:uncharacterized protein LOC115748691 isoform X1 [Rhodamnia argentea]|uniref:Uncharacterized protein LOC115748691 isoform X1 n=1 Tax=Rhodamnia argentea TaxID=178133 RepID=A0ABM3H2N1_9MYRT|nr:uncharacterized protein LOC115748691 isoform X1 [Rhodamnia argentea]
MAAASASALAPAIHFPSPVAAKTTKPALSVLVLPARRVSAGLGVSCAARMAISNDGRSTGGYDPELRLVLELATDSELYELERILFGPSYFSPLLKSITNKADVDYAMIGEDLEEREDFVAALESRFLYLAADARSVLRGWRPSYRSVLLSVRKRLNIPCSTKLSTEDLEAEIFLQLLQDFSIEESKTSLPMWESSATSDVQDSLELGFDEQKVQDFAASKFGASELRSLIFKGGGLVTLAKIYQLIARRLSGKVLLEAANYQIRKEVIKKGGQLAAINLESRAALLVAKKGFAGAASRYLGLRSMMSLLGPMLWGTFLADMVIQMLGTDYARILRAIFAFAQIRIMRTYRVPADVE